MKVSDMLSYLKNYNGPEIRIMEVCGTHTSVIAKSGIRSILPENIKLLSGPGCPVCVTPTGYIDRLINLALDNGYSIVSFGDLLKVPGSNGSLGDARAKGADIRVVYSPFNALELAKENPKLTFVFAAIGFETIAPVYGLIIKKAKDLGLENLKILCALKTMPNILDIMCTEKIDAFIAPGHVAAVTGAKLFRTHAEKHKKPFCVAGFNDDSIICAIYDLVLQVERKNAQVHNLYSSVVTDCGNETALSVIDEVFAPCDAIWRGLGLVPNSGLKLKDEFSQFDAGHDLYDDLISPSCKCGDVICGRILPTDCPMFGKACTPHLPKGPCMVSEEGTCGIWYSNNIS